VINKYKVNNKPTDNKSSELSCTVYVARIEKQGPEKSVGVVWISYKQISVVGTRSRVSVCVPATGPVQNVKKKIFFYTGTPVNDIKASSSNGCRRGGGMFSR